MRKKRKMVTSEHQQKILELFEQGHTAKQIALILDFSYETIRSRLWLLRPDSQRQSFLDRQREVEKWTKEGHAQGLTDMQIARVHPSVSRSCIRNTRLRLGLRSHAPLIRLTSEERQELYDLFEKESKQSIMDYFGISRFTYTYHKKIWKGQKERNNAIQAR
jgi:DNA-binding CsgD family transcriptional regulator